MLQDIRNETLIPPAPGRFHHRETVCNGAFIVAAGSPRGEPGAEAASAYRQIGQTLAASKLEIVQERIFGSLSAQAAVRAARREALSACGACADGPSTYVEGGPVSGEGFAGAIVRAVPRDRVRAICDVGAPCGRAWQTDEMRYVILQNIQGLPGCGYEDGQPDAQARYALRRADRLLRENGLCFRSTVRTWFYLSRILSWYDAFNHARTQMYGELGCLPGSQERASRLPASTGIGAESPGGAACSLDLLAIAGVGVVPRVEPLRNPQQQEAFRYGSAFSRGAVIRGDRETLIEISGTAAIDEHGRSLHPGDVRAQARATLERVESLLKQAGASLHDICAATVFLKHGQDAQEAREVLDEMGLDRLPAVWVVADVCRDELLFEIDAEAVIPTTRRLQRSGSLQTSR